MSDKTDFGKPIIYYECEFKEGRKDSGCVFFQPKDTYPDECKHRNPDCDICESGDRTDVVVENARLRAEVETMSKMLDKSEDDERLMIKEQERLRAEVERLTAENAKLGADAKLGRMVADAKIVGADCEEKTLTIALNPSGVVIGETLRQMAEKAGLKG